MHEGPTTESRRKFHSAMNFGMIGLTVALLAILVLVRKGMEGQYLRRSTPRAAGLPARPT